MRFEKNNDTTSVLGITRPVLVLVVVACIVHNRRADKAIERLLISDSIESFIANNTEQVQFIAVSTEENANPIAYSLC